MLTSKERILGGLWGALVGDALGVPVEFSGRAGVRADPVAGMRGYGTHNQPPGTWSDDGALTLCTVDSLLHAEFDTHDMGQRFVAWMQKGLWTATGDVFDIGNATAEALMRIVKGVPAEEAGGRDDYSNGNGSLMRVLPVALRFAHEPTEQLIERLSRASAITHGHLRSQMACGFYGLIVREMLRGASPQLAFDAARQVFAGIYQNTPELDRFRFLLEKDLSTQPEVMIDSSGYVIHTLTASIWCLLNTTNYEACVLKAVNLGGDTDTTGCVAGGLAGVCYGVGSIPQTWRATLPMQSELEALFDRFAAAIPTTQ